MKLCFFDENQENFYRHASRRTFVRVLLEKLDPTNPCYIVSANSPDAKADEMFKNKLVFLPTHFVFALRFLAFFGRQDVFVYLTSPPLSSNMNFYLAKAINSKLRNAIDELWAVPLLEQGYLNKMFDQLEIESAKGFPIKNTIFTSVSEYVAANTYVGDVAFNGFKAFFYLHILLLLLFSAAQAVFLSAKTRTQILSVSTC